MTSLLVNEGHNGNTVANGFVKGNGAACLNGNGAHHVNGNGAPHANGNTASRHAENVKNIIIRPFKPQDRPEIRRICCDTGFLGNPIEAIFSDRELFADLFTSPYLDYGPNWVWVADDGGHVVGYLLGCISTSFNYTLLYSGFQTTIKMLTRAATGCYARHARSRHFIRWLLTNGYREQPRHPGNAAHLHLNIERSHRGRGLGFRLWRAYEEQLNHAGIYNCYGAFFSWPKRRPEAVYSRLGFSIFDRKQTTIFQPEILEPVEIVCVHRKTAS